MLVIRRSHIRPDPGLLERLRNVPTGLLVDALGRTGAIDHSIRPMWNGGCFVGTAMPVWSSARNNLAVYAGLKMAKPGDVLIVATGGFKGSAVVGDLVIAMAKNCGIVAVITDGLVRDIEGIEDVGIPVYARGLSPNSPFKNGPGTVGLPISVGGSVVEAGDIVLGDRTGVVVAPQQRLDQTIAAIDGLLAKEAKMDAAVKGGMKVPDWLEQALVDTGVEYVD